MTRRRMRSAEAGPARRAPTVAIVLSGLLMVWAGCGSNPEQAPAEASAPPPSAAAASEASLPAPGDIVVDYPEGEGQGTAQRSCGSCHSSDIVRQQRLTEAQWTASVDKMIRWGAVVPDPEKAALVAYLARNYGPDNTSFTPVVTRPVGP